jgi:hypothetical protein
MAGLLGLIVIGAPDTNNIQINWLDLTINREEQKRPGRKLQPLFQQ